MSASAPRFHADLARISGPRRTGSEGERRIREWVRAELEGAGLVVTEEAFAFDPRLVQVVSPALLVLVALLFAVTAFRPGTIWPALAGAALAGLLVAVVGGALPRLDRAPRVSSVNVVARRPGPVDASVIVMAHLDSKSQRLSFFDRSLVAALGAACVFVLVAAAVLDGGAWLVRVPAIGAALAALALAAAGNGDASPGALDNGSGLAVLLELARRQRTEARSPVEWVVTSAEEEGLVGADRYFARHADRLASSGAVVINLDTLGGCGSLYLTGHRLPGRGRRSGLHALLAARAAALGIRLRPRSVPFPAAVDSAMAARRGLEAITLASGSIRDTFRHVHRPSDVPERVDPAHLERCTDLVESVLRGVTELGPAWRASV